MDSARFDDLHVLPIVRVQIQQHSHVVLRAVLNRCFSERALGGYPSAGATWQHWLATTQWGITPWKNRAANGGQLPKANASSLSAALVVFAPVDSSALVPFSELTRD